MKLFHGSKNIIEKPEFGKGKPYNDYGLGFYCTADCDMAKEWGVSKNCDGYANEYELDDSSLSILNLNDSKYCILNWLAILLENREFDVSSPLAAEGREYILKNFLPPYKSYDLILGYRADDSYFSFSQDFINGTISFGQLNYAMHLGKLGQQYVLKSEKAFSKIEFKGYEIANYSVWYEKKMERDANARKDYFSLEKNKRQKNDIFITQIIDQEMRNGDERLR